ncbi:MAG TPA: hypothetical protein VFN56_02135 [Candidatus Saccharimonadales bacterium]|nr:hypothetical protein [Candidatus Saccharimonadales bacterium]
MLTAGLVMEVALPGGVASAAAQPITSPRSLTVEAGASCGGSAPSGLTYPGCNGTVKHLFNFTVDGSAASENIGSISFQYCTTGEPVTGGIGCYAPKGINLTGATLSNDGGALTGFTVAGTSANEDASDPNGTTVVNTITIKLASATNIVAAKALSKEFSGITNPSTANQTFYVRIYAYNTTTGGTLSPTDPTLTDYGTVAASTANPIVLNGTMPESLLFCTGQSISETNNVPDCSTATAGNVSFNQLFSSTSTAWATSQMAASTNAGTGYSITVNGTTMTSGTNTITAIGNPGASSTPGTSQFGMNVVQDAAANTAVPAVAPASANVTTPSGNTFYHGEPVAPYNTGSTPGPAQFAFRTGDVVADSTSLASDPQVFTATYMVNVPGHQPAGGYTTTLTYICTATF